MTTITPGQTTVFTASFYQFAGGPLQDVTGLQFKLTRTDATVIVALTSSGIVHLGTGLYSFSYAAPAGLAAGDAVAVWTANEGSASERVTIGSSVSSSTGASTCDPWPSTYCCSLTGFSPAVTGMAIQAATDVLYNLTTQRFGLCTFTFRPCREDCSRNGGWPFDSVNWWQWGLGLYPRPALFDGMWFNVTCGSCSGTCSCGPIEQAILPEPVHSVTEVKVDGIVLSPTAYRIDDFSKLVRTDGGRWPACQDMTKADTEVGTWSVTVVIGEEVPTIGQLAVGELACEIAKSCAGQACALPGNATTVVRNGITVQFDAFTDLLKHGLLGLRWCDIFIATYNPDGMRARPQVYDVDREINRRTGTA
jgi:hypothetical protein